MMYIGPDQALPMASLLAMLFALLLSFWRRFLAIIMKIAGRLNPPKGEAGASAQSSTSSSDKSA